MILYQRWVWGLFWALLLGALGSVSAQPESPPVPESLLIEQVQGVLEVARVPEPLLQRQQAGNLSLRAVMAYARLPDPLMHLPMALHSIGLDPLSAAPAHFREWIEAAREGSLDADPDSLQSLHDWMVEGDFHEWRPLAAGATLAVASDRLVRGDGHARLRDPLGETHWKLEAASLPQPLFLVLTPADDAPTRGPSDWPASPATGGDQGLLIFDGRSLDKVTPFAFNGVDFDQDARLTGDAIEIRLPEKKGWPRLGIATTGRVLSMPGPDEVVVARVTAVIDADTSTGLSFSLTPPDAALEDPATTNNLEVQLVNHGQGQGELLVSTRATRTHYKRPFRWPDGNAELHVLLRPDQVVDLRSRGGVQLAQVPLDVDLGGSDWAVLTHLQVNRKNRSGQLTLRRLAVDEIPFRPLPDVDDIANQTETFTIFDGTALEPFWSPATSDPHRFHRFARLEHGALRLQWSAADKQKWHGIDTPEAVLWLDRLHGAGEARIDVRLEGAATKGFEIALQGAFTLPGNTMSSEAYKLQILEDADGTYRASSGVPQRKADVLGTAGLGAVPDDISLILTPGAVRVEGQGLPEGKVDFPLARSGSGLRMQLRTLPTPEGDAALHLREVRVSRMPGLPLPPPQPREKVDPLPTTVFFDTEPGSTWQGKSPGDTDYEALASQKAQGLTLKRRDRIPNAHRIALSSKEPIVALDERLARTPFEITLMVDSEPSLGTSIWLHEQPDRFEKSAIAMLNLYEIPDGPDAGKLQVQLKAGHFSYGRWQRVLSVNQWKERWDGSIRLHLGDGWLAVALGDDRLMVSPLSQAAAGRQFYLTITPGGPVDRDPGQVTLREIRGGWAMPRGMTGLERMHLLDDAEFDPDRFLDLLAEEATLRHSAEGDRE